MREIISVIFFLAAILSGCAGSNTANNYGTEAAQPITITVMTTDQFGNPVDGKIVLDGDLRGLKEVELRYDPAKGGTVFFDSMSGYNQPSPLDLAIANFADGELVKGVYTRTGSVANVCPRSISDQGLLVDVPLTVNGLAVDYKSGYCQTVDTASDTNIAGSNPFFIPAKALKAEQTYHYDILISDSSKMVYMATTPVSGEVFVDGRSVGWVKEDFLGVQLPMKGNVTLSFGKVSGHETAKDMTFVADDVTFEDNHHWALYDPSVNALVCFSAIQSETSPVNGIVLVDGSTKINTEYSYPGCIGLDTSSSHTAVFQDRDSYQSKDSLTISQQSHVGCEGDFVPGGQLDCVGKYFFVQPATELTSFNVQVKFTGPYKGDNEYPIMGRYEIKGVDYQAQSYSQVLKQSEIFTLTMLPIAALMPDVPSITVDSSKLTVDDFEYNPEFNQWVYAVHYSPLPGAIEACVTSLNQNLANVSSQVDMNFDGTKPVNSWDAEQDCSWFTAAGNHLIAPNWLQGYQLTVAEIHIPEGKLAEHSQFEFLFIPEPTYHQICVKAVTVEAGLSLNSHFLGWTYAGDVCVRVDKAIPNTLTIEGKGSQSFTADDPALSGTYSEIQFTDF